MRLKPSFGINFKLFLLLGTIISLAMAALFLSTSREVRILATRLDWQGSPLTEQVELLTDAYSAGGWEQIQSTLGRSEFEDEFLQWMVVSANQQQIVSSNEALTVTGISVDDAVTRFDLQHVDSQERLSLEASTDQQIPLVVDGSQVGTIYQLFNGGTRIPVGQGGPEVRIVKFNLNADASLINGAQIDSLISPNRINNRILMYAVGIGLLALCGGALLGLQITRPLQNLVDGTQRIEAGDYGHTLPVKSQDEVGILTGSFNAMSISLQQNAELRKRLIADIAHELRTPVTGLRCQLEALSDGVTQFSPQQLEGLLTDTLQLQQLIEDLRELNQAEDHKLHIEKSDCGLQQIIESAERACNIADKNLSLQVSYADQALMLHTDPLRLRQVLVNLLANAINHSPDGGVIWIDVESASAQEGNVLITLRDEGVGIPEEELENVFERFYRIDEHRSRDAGGSGLGLAIARELMSLLEGKVFASRPVQGGTQMNIVLPLA